MIAHHHITEQLPASAGRPSVEPGDQPASVSSSRTIFCRALPRRHVVIGALEFDFEIDVTGRDAKRPTSGCHAEKQKPTLSS